MTSWKQHDTHLEQQLKNHYQHLYEEPINPRIVWERLLPQLDAQRKLPWWRAQPGKGPQLDKPIAASKRPYSGHRLSLRATLVVALVVILLVLVGSAYASEIPVLNSLFHMEQGTQHILQTDQYTDFHQSKTVNGFTITIEKVYADANRVIVGYTVNGTAGQEPNATFAFGLSTLTTQQGTSLRLMQGIGSDAIEGITGNVFSFDASNIQNDPKDLQLRLAIPYGRQPAASAFKISGTLSFHFSVPFHAGKVISVHQSFVADGKTVLLERVVITSSETRLYVRGFSSQDEVNNYYISADLLVDGKTYIGGGGYQATDIWMMDFDVPLLDKHGEWTVEIRKEINLKDSHTGIYGPVPVNGAMWTFHFNVA